MLSVNREQKNSDVDTDFVSHATAYTSYENDASSGTCAFHNLASGLGSEEHSVYVHVHELQTDKKQDNGAQ